MVNETAREDLLDFSKKILNEAFGPNKNSTEETLLPKVEDPKGVQTSAVSPSPTMSESKVGPRLEQKINVSSIQEQPVKGASSDLVDSIEAKNLDTSEGAKDITSNEDTTEAIRSPGFMEMKLKRKSNMVSEENDTNYSEDVQPVTDELHIETDNPSHLFWVPAHLHPEIAPNEFRRWLKNHAKDGFNSGVGSLRRRKSALSRQYIPSEAEYDEETDKKKEPEKKTSGFDWESYGILEGNISPTAESTKLNILRRSLSLNLPPFMGGTINPNDPNIFDRHSSPDVDSKVLVPRMSPALKRAARTKLRRNSVAGEENARRFSAHRRTRSTHVSSDKGKQTEDNNVLSKILKKKSDSALSAPQIIIEKVDMNLTDRNSNEIVDEPEEISKDIELDCIDVKDGTGPIRITLKDNGPEVAVPEVTPSLKRTSSLPSEADELSSELSIELSSELSIELPSELSSELSSELQAEQVDKSDLLKVDTSLSATTSPSTSPTTTSPVSPTSAAPTQSKRTSAWSWLWPGGSEEKLKDKDKDNERDKEEKEQKSKKNKSDKSEKSDKSDENNDSIVKEKDKEKSTKKSFSSIFSWQNKAKSTDDSSANTNTTSLLQPTISNKKTKYTNYNRLPIHVERAIYRLSHVKLANPRRPLHEQVLISNMMFWYLSLINKQQVECGGSGNPNAEIAANKVKSKVGKEKTGRKRKKSEKKLGLTRKGAGPGSSAEIAYKAPQYDVNQISQQYITPPISNSSASYSNEFEEETVEDYGDNSEEEIQAHNYHHYNDGYLSDGTDGGYMDETNGRIESSHSGGLLHSSAEFDNIGESSNGVKITKNYARSPSPNGRMSGRSKSPTGQRSSSPDGRSTTVSSNAQRNSVPPSNKRKLIKIPRNRSSSAGTRPSNSHKVSSKISTVNSIADDEDDDVPLGLYKQLSSNTK